jgi:hypothetical protein
MTAPTNNPVVSSIPYVGPLLLLGQTTNEYQPSVIRTWNVIIPTPLIGNEAQVGYAAFTADGITVNRGIGTSATLTQFVGVFANQYFQEGDVGSLTYNTTFGNTFTVPVVSQGSVFCYNGSAISASYYATAGSVNPLSVALVSTSATCPVGAFFQGTAPSGVTVSLDVSSVCRPTNQAYSFYPSSGYGQGAPGSQTVVGAGFLIDILKLS